MLNFLLCFSFLFGSIAAHAADTSIQKKPKKILLATVNDFPIRDTRPDDYVVIQAARDIVRHQIVLTELGKGSSLKDVVAWRKKKVDELRWRLRALKAIAKDPSRVQEFYDQLPEPKTMTFERWEKWTKAHRTPEKIARYAEWSNIGRMRIDLNGKQSEWPTWQLLESMAQEAFAVRKSTPARLVERVLNKDDIAELAKLGRALYMSSQAGDPFSQGDPPGPDTLEGMMMGPDGILVSSLESELWDIKQYERLQAAKVKIIDKRLKNIRKALAQKPKGGRTRKQLLTPMTPEQALSEFKRDERGRAPLAYLTLAKSGAGSKSLLLGKIKDPDPGIAANAIFMLHYLKISEAVEPVLAARPWDSRRGSESLSQTSLALLAELAPGKVPDIADGIIKDFEKQTTHADLGKYVSSNARIALYHLGKLPGGADLLAGYLASPDGGVQLEAARQLSYLRDTRALDAAERHFLPLSQDNHTADYRVPVEIIERLAAGQPATVPRSVKFLDEFAKKHNDEKTSNLARRLELSTLPEPEKWVRVTEWAQRGNPELAYFANEMIEAGYREDRPEAIKALEVLAGDSDPRRNSRAKELLMLRKMKQN